MILSFPLLNAEPYIFFYHATVIAAKKSCNAKIEYLMMLWAVLQNQ